MPVPTLLPSNSCCWHFGGLLCTFSLQWDFMHRLSVFAMIKPHLGGWERWNWTWSRRLDSVFSRQHRVVFTVNTRVKDTLFITGTVYQASSCKVPPPSCPSNLLFWLKVALNRPLQIHVYSHRSSSVLLVLSLSIATMTVTIYVFGGWAICPGLSLVAAHSHA